MGYARQQPTSDRMMLESIRALRRLEDQHMARMEALWKQTRTALRHAIVGHIMDATGGARWSAAHRRTGVLFRIERHAKDLLAHFKTHAAEAHRNNLLIVRNTAAARTAWILRSVTPPNRVVNVSFDHRHVAREADVPGIMGAASWSDRLDGWVDAWHSALTHNLNLGMINGGTSGDAADEIDATRAGSPSSGFWDAVDRLFRNSSLQEASDAFDQVSRENARLGANHVYAAHADSIVCDECDSYDGEDRRDLPGVYIPIHPFCRCFWRIVPKPWAELADDDTRASMRAQGINEDTMVQFDAEGKASAVVTVSFPDFVEQAIVPELSPMGFLPKKAGI